MLSKVCVLLDKNNFIQSEVNHALSIILRAYDEIQYMILKGKNIKFELKQMKGFTVSYDTFYVSLIMGSEKLCFQYDKFEHLVEEIYAYFQNKYPINYDYKLIDPIYFSLFFYDLLDKIVDVKYDIVNVSDFKLLRHNSAPVSMEESESYKALINNGKRIYTPFKSNHIIDSDYDRLKASLNSIKENGYPYHDKLVILYNDEMFIRDGQHRIAVLKYLFGDVDVKVVRFYLKDNYFYA